MYGTLHKVCRSLGMPPKGCRDDVTGARTKNLRLSFN